MAETTTHSTEMTREEMADYLRSIADELGSGSGSVRVPVGNKAVHLSPSDSIESEATVTERSRRLRKDTEEMVLKFKWNPVEDTAESDTGSAPARDAEPGRDSTSRSETDDVGR
ncbi:amphi-Trp domain-containing protein [Halorarum salinum]|uniref:Amphi-Trp domain-containing protein n=1 Tax=Halorarum salinum TaxID=2743089 RepID=A0A7D5Q8F2_9EURY|nr:amphi-Trp domain-containing protein [Halobaculum salinum]QLG60916.1 amphi-Trp domain-containing protein [Halobaculum salinum]